MLLELNTENLKNINNPSFLEYARIYTDIYENFLEQVKGNGLDYNTPSAALLAEIRSRLQEKGVVFRNDNKSIFVNWISPACEACRKGEDSVTFYLSLKCHRSCYYCFNPNQEDYAYSAGNKRDCISELNQISKSGQKLAFIALTGGEPLLHKREVMEFLSHAKEKFPKAHTRLYTSGDLLDQDTIKSLKDAKLDEIRFSIKLEDTIELRKKVRDKIEETMGAIPKVMVEMPVIPGTLEEMKELLLALNDIGIAGINLLEFCFPYNNTHEFQKRSFKLKNPPFKVLYDYWYAGGLPVADSEQECLALLEYAIDEKLRIGVHYCSLENKHTGQVFQQNKKENRSNLIYLSTKDFFLKTAKVFGDDISEVLKVFKRRKITNYRINEKYNYLEFNVKDISLLKALAIEVGISSGIMEIRDGEKVLRELRIELTNPQEFNMYLI